MTHKKKSSFTIECVPQNVFIAFEHFIYITSEILKFAIQYDGVIMLIQGLDQCAERMKRAGIHFTVR